MLYCCYIVRENCQFNICWVVVILFVSVWQENSASLMMMMTVVESPLVYDYLMG